MKLYALLALVILACSGCNHTRDLSKYEPFSDYEKASLELKRPMDLCKMKLSGQHFFNRYYLTTKGNGIEYGHSRIVTLPKGSPIEIYDSKRYSTIGVNAFYALGKCSHPETGEEFKFQYLLGVANFIDGIPWENAPISQRIYVGYSGKEYKNNHNQQVDPTVKTPVESGNEQGTAGHP